MGWPMMRIEIIGTEAQMADIKNAFEKQRAADFSEFSASICNDIW